MAKKKKISKNGLFLLTVVIVCVGVVATIMMFLPAVNFVIESKIASKTITISGIEAVFGGKMENAEFGISIDTWKFNTVSLIGYVLPLIGVIFALVGYKTRSTFIYILAAVAMLAGTVMIFLEPQAFVNVNGLQEFVKLIPAKLAVGPILGGICGIVSTLACAGAAVVKK